MGTAEVDIRDQDTCEWTEVLYSQPFAVDDLCHWPLADPFTYVCFI